jgi:hypothetical protein
MASALSPSSEQYRLVTVPQKQKPIKNGIFAALSLSKMLGAIRSAAYDVCRLELGPRSRQ